MRRPTMVAAFVILAGTACSRDSGAAKTAADSAAIVDSVSATNSAGTLEGSPANAGAVDSVKPPINSTEGTIGETRKPAKSGAPRDSAIAGPYGTIDSTGKIRK